MEMESRSAVTSQVITYKQIANAHRSGGQSIMFASQS